MSHTRLPRRPPPKSSCDAVIRDGSFVKFRAGLWLPFFSLFAHLPFVVLEDSAARKLPPRSEGGCSEMFAGGPFFFFLRLARLASERDGNGEKRAFCLPSGGCYKSLSRGAV